MKKQHDQFAEFPKEDVRSAIHAGIIQAEKQVNDNKINITFRNKVNIGKRKVLYATCSVLTILGLLVVSSYFSPALASSLSQLPIIGSIFGSSDMNGLRQAHEKGLISEVGETETVNGISVTLSEILYDQNNITIGFFIESDKQLEDFYFDAGDFTINGKSPAGATGSYGEKNLSATTRTAIQEINVTEDMPEEFELGLKLQGKNGETWHFSTPIKRIDNIHKISAPHSQTVDGLKLKITEISVSETGLSIAYESSEKGTDFDLSRGGMIDFLVVDQNGNKITGHSGGASGELVKDKIVFKSNKHFDPLDSNVTELTITPYLDIPSDGRGVEIDENGKEKEIEYKEPSIQPIEFDSFKVKIRQ